MIALNNVYVLWYRNKNKKKDEKTIGIVLLEPFVFICTVSMSSITGPKFNLAQFFSLEFILIKVNLPEIARLSNFTGNIEKCALLQLFSKMIRFVLI